MAKRFAFLTGSQTLGLRRSGWSDHIEIIGGAEPALRGFSDPEYCGGAYRALATSGRSAILESDLLGVVNVAVVTALEAVGLH